MILEAYYSAYINLFFELSQEEKYDFRIKSKSTLCCIYIFVKEKSRAYIMSSFRYIDKENPTITLLWSLRMREKQK